MSFAELLAHSCFSFLEGASQPVELAERAVQQRLSALALCDRDGLYGSVRLHVAAKRLKLPVIVGAELTLETALAPAYAQHAVPTVALLVQDSAGYGALCRLLTSAHAHSDKGQAAIPLAAICEDACGLSAVVPWSLQHPLGEEQLGMLRDAFGARLSIAVWRHLRIDDEARTKAAQRLAAQFEVPIVASNRPFYHHRSRKPLSDVLACIRLKTTLDEAGTRLTPNAEAELKGARAMHKLFPHHPQWLAESIAIAERCTFSLSEVKYSFPSDYGASNLTADENLRRAVEVGCRERYPTGVPVDVAHQIDKELSIIAQLRVAPYFLSVQQVVHMARERRILCQGRGSAANSAVCYVLGVTAVDPARSSLLFERFMSHARNEPPDIDIDFEHERREEVIQEIYQRYGRDRAAMVSEVIAFRGKSGLREVGKVFGLSSEQLDRLSSIASHAGGDRVDGAALRKRGLDPNNGRLRQVVTLAAQLAGFPRHLSIHVGGFVLSAKPLYTVAPVEPARMKNRSVLPWDKDDIEALGFFKVDVLGLGMLTAIRKAQQLIHQQQHGSLTHFDPLDALDHIPAEDPRVYEAISRADTVGVFQIESRAQMAMLPILKPRCFYDLVVEVGIVRPGPIQGKMVHPYLRRRTGEEAVRYPHPCLEPILARTLGVPLFQEQVMQIAIVGAGYDPGEADQLRRDMAAWRKTGQLERHKKKLLRGFVQRGISRSFGERLYQQMMGFGDYGFPESHAASFALLVYASAWIKVHHPAAFVCALINSQPMGFYAPGSLVKDAQKHGVQVLPVRVEVSHYDCHLEATKDGGQPALRLGFRLIKGLSRTAVDNLVQARKKGPFNDLDDFVRRTRLRRNEYDVLAEAGAFSGFMPSRREALWRLRMPHAGELFEGYSIESQQPAGLPPLSGAEQLSLDYDAVGLSLHDHPICYLNKTLRKRRVLKAHSQSTWKQNQQVTVAGKVLTRQRPVTASGVVFVTLEDETGTINVVLYTTVFQRYELVAKHAGLMLVRGRIDRRGEVVHLRAQHLERLDMPAGQPLRIRSRDFH